MALISPDVRLTAVVGATAVGKTAVGMEIAERIGGEIVSADAVAVYRDLNIGTAKPTREERQRVPFHLVDVASPDEDFTVADFERQAETAFAQIRQRGNIPLLVGGTGLYVRSVTATLSIPEVPPQVEFRERLWAESEISGAAVLHERLIQIDPVSAAKILPGDAKRIIRALEVFAVTGKPLSSFHTAEGVQGVPKPGIRIFGLELEREALYRRIETRVDAMLREGLLDEVRGLLTRYPPDCKSLQSLGYRHMVAFLTGQVPFEQAVSEMKRDTRRFARRQLMWFRGDNRTEWISVGEKKPSEVAELILQSLMPDKM